MRIISFILTLFFGAQGLCNPFIMNWALLGSENSDLPAGALIWFVGDTCPKDFLILNQKYELSRSTYRKLFKQAKTVHGAGDGVTTFNLPNLSGLSLRASGYQSFGGYNYGSHPGVRRNHAIENIVGEASTGAESFFNGSGWGALRASEINYGTRNTSLATDKYRTVFSINASRVVSTDTTTHPADYSLIFCVKTN